MLVKIFTLEMLSDDQIGYWEGKHACVCHSPYSNLAISN